MELFEGFDAPEMAIIGVLIAVQLGLQVAGIVHLVRSPGALQGRKLIWLLVIILGEMLGVILYFAWGRRTLASLEPAVAAPAASAADARSAADALYGVGDSDLPPPPPPPGQDA